MDKQHRSQLEINDLIGDAVNNAVAGRSQIDSESVLSALSDEQARSITGGLMIDVDILNLIFSSLVPGMTLPTDISLLEILST